MSGNTFGAVSWTDGKREAPMLPETPWLVRCPHCRALLWIDELERLGKVWSWERGLKFEDARDYKTPSAKDYFALLKRGVADEKKLMYVRTCAWWSGNDARREPPVTFRIPPGMDWRCFVRETPEPKPLAKRERLNLEALMAMLPESDENARLMKSEALRELGRFDEALALLAVPISDNLAEAAGIIRQLVEQRDTRVRQMMFK